MLYVNHSLLQTLNCKQYIEGYKWNTIKELQLKDPYFKAMVDKYNYDRIKDGLGVLFKQIYGQTKEVWLTSHFNELLSKNIQQDIARKYLITQSLVDTANYANKKYPYIAKYRKFLPYSSPKNNSIAQIFKLYYGMTLKKYMQTHIDVALKVIVNYALTHSAEKTINQFDHFHSNISAKLLDEIAKRHITGFSKPYSELLKDATVYYSTHTLSETLNNFPELQLTKKILDKTFLKYYSITKRKWQCLSIKHYINVVHTAKAQLFYFNWKVTAGENYSLTENNIKTKKYNFICKHCHNVFKCTISNMFSNNKHYYDKCPNCTVSKSSYGERIINSYLTAINIPFISQCSVRINGKLHKFDFYLPKQKMIIEYQGLQHFEEISFFTNHHNHRTLAKQKQLDFIKRQYAKDNGMTFVAIDGRKYVNLSQINNFLNQLFNLKITKNELLRNYYYRTKNGDFYLYENEIFKYAMKYTYSETAKHFSIERHRVQEIAEKLR